MEDTKPIQAGVAKMAAQIESALLDGHGDIEDVLGNPRFTLTLAVKSLSSFALANDPSGVVLLGDLQMRLNGWLARIDRCLPRMSREMTLREATPALVEVLREVPTALEDLKRLSKYASPLAMWG
jgi:hypothetical protein